jgi:diguanylate cyclase (GGDEF)-like protein/PAS domain S-box-containing protein
VASMKPNEDPGKPVGAPREPVGAETNDVGTNWKGLAWVAIWVTAGLIVFEQLKHILFPHLTPRQHQAVTVVAGALAAVVGSYLSTRRFKSALARHAQTEKKLALERNVLRTVTDNIPDSIFAKDTEGRYQLANKAFGKLHGVQSPDELLGKTAFDLFPREKAIALHAEDLGVMKSRGAILESERTAKSQDGSTIWLQTTKVPLIDRNENVVGIVGLHRNVTRRKDAEQKLRQSEANLAAAQRIAHFGSVELDLANSDDPEKYPVRWSDEVFRIFGYEPGSVEVSRQTYFRSVHPDDRERLRNVLARAIAEAKAFAIDFRVVRPDGTERNIQERGYVLCDPRTQKPSKLVGSIQDITESVQAEARLQKANQELAERVHELQQRSKEITILSDMGSRLQACQNVDEAYVEITVAAEQLFSNWSGALYVIRASRTTVETVADWGNPSHRDRVFPPDDCWALRRGQPQIFRNGQKTTVCSHIDPLEVTESLCVPLMAQSEALGILNLQRLRKNDASEPAPAFSGEEERRLAIVFAEQVGLALGNLKLRESLRNQSICDSLTGLFNRRYMEESLEREFSRAARKKSTVAILMVDIDHFKRFNDTFGHQAGDALLRALGDLLKRHTRGQDIACRFGGEEFVLVLTDANLNGAMQRAEILRQQVKELSVEYAGQLLGAISVSIGVAVYPEHGATMIDVMRASDQALYRAKREGRDRVAVWSVQALV